MIRLFILAFLFSLSAMAGFTVPATPHPVNDYAGVLTPAGKESIAKSIIDLKAATGAQVGVLIVDTLDGDSIEEAANRVFRSWKLGSAASDDGLLVMFAIKDRKSRIEVGQGLEGIMTDADSKRILVSVRSYLKAGNFDAAVKSTVDSIKDRIVANKAEIQAGPPAPTDNSGFLKLLLSLGLVGLVVFLVNRSRKKAEKEEALKKAKEPNHVWNQGPIYGDSYRSARSNRDNYSAVAASAAIASDNSSSRRSSYYSSSDDSSSSSSSSSSDWGGGGGDSSGGGSSDSW